MRSLLPVIYSTITLLALGGNNANSGELKEKCENILKKENDLSKRTQMLMDCVTSIAIAVEQSNMGPITILKSFSKSKKDAGSKAEIEIDVGPYEGDAMVIISASGSTFYNSDK